MLILSLNVYYNIAWVFAFTAKYVDSKLRAGNKVSLLTNCSFLKSWALVNFMFIYKLVSSGPYFNIIIFLSTALFHFIW